MILFVSENFKEALFVSEKIKALMVSENVRGINCFWKFKWY